MDSTSYRKSKTSFSMMRQFCQNYRKRNIKTIPTTTTTPKTNSAIKMTSILKNLTLSLPTSTQIYEQYQPPNQKGQFNSDYSQRNCFIRPLLNIDQKPITYIAQTSLLQTMKQFYQSTNPLTPKSNLNQLELIKRKIATAKQHKQQLSASMRHNYILQNQYKHQIHQQRDNPILPRQYINTKQNIFPNSDHS